MMLIKLGLGWISEPNDYVRQATPAEYVVEIERLQAERDLWEARCIGAVWLLPDEMKLGELQEAARRAAELLRYANQQATPLTEK